MITDAKEAREKMQEVLEDFIKKMDDFLQEITVEELKGDRVSRGRVLAAAMLLPKMGELLSTMRELLKENLILDEEIAERIDIIEGRLTN